MRSLPAIAILAALLLAGCSQGPGHSPDAGASAPPGSLEPPSQPSPLSVFHLDGTATVGLWARNDPDGMGGYPRLAFNITPATVAIVVEVAWDDPRQDLDARTWPERLQECPPTWQPPDPWSLGDDLACELSNLDGRRAFMDAEGGPGQGDSPSRVAVDAAQVAEMRERCGEEGCTWAAWAWARHPVVGLQWDLWVSVFETPVPEGYTAIPAAQAIHR